MWVIVEFLISTLNWNNLKSVFMIILSPCSWPETFACNFRQAQVYMFFVAFTMLFWVCSLIYYEAKQTPLNYFWLVHPLFADVRRQKPMSFWFVSGSYSVFTIRVLCTTTYVIHFLSFMNLSFSRFFTKHLLCVCKCVLQITFCPYPIFPRQIYSDFLCFSCLKETLNKTATWQKRKSHRFVRCHLYDMFNGSWIRFS